MPPLTADVCDKPQKFAQAVIDGRKDDEKDHDDGDDDARRFYDFSKRRPSDLFEFGKYFFDLSAHPDKYVGLFRSCFRFHFYSLNV